MSEKLDRGARRDADDARRRQGGRPFFAGFVLATALAVMIASWHGASARGNADGLLSASESALSYTRMESFFGREPWPAGAVVLAAAKPEKDEKLAEWREEGIRMAAELTGIPREFFRWLQDKGVPVGEFMHFLMPFLEWLDMVEPHNGTSPPSRPRSQPGERTI